MKVICDECQVAYEQELDSHELGEPNLCCEHCVWKVSNNGEPQPPHTCKKESA